MDSVERKKPAEQNFLTFSDKMKGDRILKLKNKKIYSSFEALYHSDKTAVVPSFATEGSVSKLPHSLPIKHSLQILLTGVVLSASKQVV